MYVAWQFKNNFILFSASASSFKTDRLDFNKLPGRWPPMWAALNTERLTSCLSASPFGFNKLINLYLASCRLCQIRKRIALPFFTLNLCDTCADKQSHLSPDKKVFTSIVRHLIHPQGCLVFRRLNSRPRRKRSGGTWKEQWCKLTARLEDEERWKN